MREIVAILRGLQPRDAEAVGAALVAAGIAKPENMVKGALKLNVDQAAGAAVNMAYVQKGDLVKSVCRPGAQTDVGQRLTRGIADDAFKVAALYTFPTKTTIGGIFEIMHRYVNPLIDFQNERQRKGTWLFLKSMSGFT